MNYPRHAIHVGSPRTHGINGRCKNRALMFEHSSVQFWSKSNSSFLPCRFPKSIAPLTRAWRNPSCHRRLRISSFDQDVLQNRHVILHQAPLAHWRTPSSAFHAAMRIRLTGVNRRASFLYNGSVNDAEISALLHRPSMCVRSIGGGVSASTASRVTPVKDSPMSEISLG